MNTVLAPGKITKMQKEQGRATIFKYENIFDLTVKRIKSLQVY